MLKKDISEIVLVNKILFRRILKIFLYTLFYFYIAFSIASLHGCDKKNDRLSFEQQINRRAQTVKLLEEKFRAKMFDCTSKKIINQVVILDTLILGIKKEDDHFIIRAKVNGGCTTKYFAELKCSKEIADQFNKTKSNYSVLAARINNILESNLLAEVDSLSGENSHFNIGNAVLLKGECLALAEVPAIINAN